MNDKMKLFLEPDSCLDPCGDLKTRDAKLLSLSGRALSFGGGYLRELLPALNKAEDLSNALEIRDLFLGGVSAQSGVHGATLRFRHKFLATQDRREVSAEELLHLPVIPRLVKAIFDFFFTEDLYGHWRDKAPLILSSGSFYGDDFALPAALKRCIVFALEKDWYGYSDSCGRRETRDALAELENVRMPHGRSVDASHVAVTLGGTAGISSVLDYLSTNADSRGLALCALPNYPPLVAALGKRYDVQFAEMHLRDGRIDLEPVIERVDERHRVLLLQTVVNPWGLRVSEAQLTRLIDSVPSSCTVVLDECHECFGPAEAVPSPPLRRNVVRVNSLSKRLAAPGLKVGWITAAPAFIAGFYEHASTTYGGPPSVFYLLLEVFARFEAARISGMKSMGGSLDKFQADYGLSSRALDAAFVQYVQSIRSFERSLLKQRSTAMHRLEAAGFGLVVSDYSNNVLATGADRESYAFYEELMATSHVSVYPGIMCLHGTRGSFRISPCIPAVDLHPGLDRIARFRGAP